MCEQPVAKLNEHMVKLGITPKWEVVDIATGAHINKFLARVESPVVPNGPKFRSESVGLSKKEAKRLAASLFIQKYLGDTNNNPFSVLQKPNSAFTCSVQVTENNRNSHSVLQLLCAKYNLPKPEFTEFESTGPPHSKRFIFACKVSSFFTEGKGSTKAEAKLQATTKMIELLKQEAEVYETFESPQSIAANSTEIVSLSNKFSGPTPIGTFGRRRSSSILSVGSDIFSTSNGSSLVLNKASKTIDTPNVVIEVYNSPKKVECIGEGSESSASNTSLIDLDDPEPKTSALNKARCKSMTNLSDCSDSKAYSELLQNLYRAQAISKIDAALERAERDLYNEILNTLPNRQSQRQKLVMVLNHEFEVCINHGSHVKILEGDQQCTDPSIRIAALTKLLMDMKNYSAISGVEKFKE